MILRRALTLLTATAFLAGSAGCDVLQERLKNADIDTGVLDDLEPEVEMTQPVLRKGPSLEQLGAYYCPQVISDPLVALGCSVALGSPPPKSQLTFEFGVSITVKNPNDVPIPMLDVLLALTLFEGQQAEELGAICISMCSEDNPNCDGTPRGADACTADEPTIRTLDDFVDRLPGLIYDLATGDAIEELKKWQVAAGGDVTLDLSFVLGVDQALSVFEKTAIKYVEDYLAGRDPKLEVPISAQGSVFVRVPALGRIGVNYGPLSGTWVIQ